MSDYAGFTVPHMFTFTELIAPADTEQYKGAYFYFIQDIVEEAYVYNTHKILFRYD